MAIQPLRRSLLAAILAAAAGGALVRAQQVQTQSPVPPSQPIFRAGTKLIVETVTVKDKDGNPIKGLAAKDFVLTEDGEPQTIVFVEYQELATDAVPATALTAGAPTAPPPDAPAAAPAPSAAGAPAGAAPTPSPTNVTLAAQPVIASGRPGEIKYQGKRLLVLYFDSTALPPADLIRAYNAAKNYVDTQMTASDLMAVLSFDGGGVRVRQDFTANRERLQYVIQAVVFGEDRDGDGLPDPPEGGTAFGQNDAEFTIFNTDRQLAALQTAVTMLRPLPEQKALIYFASGLRLNGADNQAQLRATTNAAVRANVAIYPVDARGLVAMAPLGDATQRSPGGIGMFTGRLAETTASNFQRSQDSLYSLAKDTGGKALLDYNDLTKGIKQAAEGLTSYYIIGYNSTHTANDGKLRRVRITLAPPAAGELAYRQGYYADKEFAKFNNSDKERQLEEALMLGDPITEITIAMEVNYFQLNRAEYFVPVSVKIPGSELALARKGGANRWLMDFIGEIKDDYGNTIQNVRDKLEKNLSDETVNQMSTRPIQYETGFTLLPGKYVIKLLARDAETGRIGTYQASFTIPNLNREEVRLPTSSVILSSQRVAIDDAIFTVQQKNPVLAANPLFYEGQKLVPSVTRVFSQARDLYVFLQAYEREATATRPLVAFASFYQGDAKVFESTPVTVTDGIDARSKAVPIRFSIPLQSVPLGRYECQISILDPEAQKTAYWRVPIAVVP